MAASDPEDVTLNTLHEDLKAGFADLKGEVGTGFADLKGEIHDLKAALVAGFRSLPTREASEEMVRLLREGNRLQEARLTGLDARIREQHLEIQQAVRGLAEGVRAIMDGVRAITQVLQALIEGQRALHEDIRALIARLDALIKGRGDGAPAP